jgi:hypothetical protein
MIYYCGIGFDYLMVVKSVYSEGQSEQRLLSDWLSFCMKVLHQLEFFLISQSLFRRYSTAIPLVTSKMEVCDKHYCIFSVLEQCSRKDFLILHIK